MMRLHYVSLFQSLEGETTFGAPLQWTVFLRTGGCNVRCWADRGYCDAPHTLFPFSRFPSEPLPQVAKKIIAKDKVDCKRLTITGGEPLLQYGQVNELANAFKSMTKPWTTCLETNGTLPVEDCFAAFDCVIMDLKTPKSGAFREDAHLDNLAKLRPWDVAKVVIEDREDFEWLVSTLAARPTKAVVAVGPMYAKKDYEPGGAPVVKPSCLVEWIRSEGKAWRLNLQLHKDVWPEAHGEPVRDLKDVDVEGMAAKEV